MAKFLLVTKGVAAVSLLLLSFFITEPNAEIYKYVDKDGVIHFTEVPLSPNYRPIPSPLTLPTLTPVPATKSKAKAGPKTPSTFFAGYILSLERVERPANPKERQGAKIHLLTFGNYMKSYEDHAIGIVWENQVASMAFALENMTDHSMKILWDESVYISADGVSHRIMHSGVKFIDRNSPQPPSVVVRKGKYQDVVLPAANVEWLKFSSKWLENPLFPSWQDGGTIDEFQKKVSVLAGKSIQILLALEIEGNINDYIFTFSIDEVKTWKKGEKPGEQKGSKRKNP
jgi:hypothetical protein